jgi:putative hydroxymethylpyrimidine transport system substrate-binding protein
VGYSVSGIEQATLATMAQHAKIDPQSIKLINVNFQLTSALLAGRWTRSLAAIVISKRWS